MQVANNKEEHKNITNNKQRVLSVFKIVWMFSIQKMSDFSSSLLLFYDIIDSGRSIKLHSRTDLFWNISDGVCPVRLIP